LEIHGEGCRFGISISIDNGGGLKVARLAERRPNTSWSDYPNGTSGANKRNCRIYFNSWMVQLVEINVCMGKNEGGRIYAVYSMRLSIICPSSKNFWSPRKLKQSDGITRFDISLFTEVVNV
jgi:hypothetical protein